MRILYCFLFFSVFCWSQKPVEIKIDSLTSSDSIPDERVYLLSYHITNLTNRTLSFFFDPNGFGGSLTNKLFYKCYQNDEFLDSSHLLTSSSPSKTIEIDELALGMEGKSEQERNAILKKFLAERYDIHLDSIQGDTDIQEDGQMNYTKRNRRKTILDQVFVIGPNQTKAFTQKMYWDKQRYFTNDPHEYYVDEKAKHEFEITMVLMKEPFKDRLPAEKYEEIMNNPDFIKGVFTSNKVRIHFGE